MASYEGRRLKGSAANIATLRLKRHLPSVDSVALMQSAKMTASDTAGRKRYLSLLDVEVDWHELAPSSAATIARGQIAVKWNSLPIRDRHLRQSDRRRNTCFIVISFQLSQSRLTDSKAALKPKTPDRVTVSSFQVVGTLDLLVGHQRHFHFHFGFS